MIDVRVGLCSWTDRSLAASGFYPRGASSPAARLFHYSQKFTAVEVDSTFYALPDPGMAIRWIASTPNGFMFGMKAFALFTFHRARYASLPDWLKSELGPREPTDPVDRSEVRHELRVRLYRELLALADALHSAGRLAYILFQFPPNHACSREGLIYLKRIREMSGRLPLAVEVRNRSWLAPENRDKFFRALEDENIAYTAVDEPETEWSVGRDWPVTASWGTLARFHGRNVRAWTERGAPVGERFDWDYSRAELEEWAPSVDAARRACRDGSTVYLMYNNCVGDKPVRAAQMMSEILGLDDALARKDLGL